MKSYKLGFALVLIALFCSSICAQAESERNKGIQLYRDGQFADSVKVLEDEIAAGRSDFLTGMYLSAGYVHIDQPKKAVSILTELKPVDDGFVPLKYEKKWKVIKKPLPHFGSHYKFSSGYGMVELLIEFKSDGTIGFILPFRASSAKIVSIIEPVAKQIEFEPAVVGGKPVTTVTVFRYELTDY